MSEDNDLLESSDFYIEYLCDYLDDLTKAVRAASSPANMFAILGDATPEEHHDLFKWAQVQNAAQVVSSYYAGLVLRASWMSEPEASDVLALRLGRALLGVSPDQG